jgi:hypothetical protein
MASNASTLSPADRERAIERLTTARHAVDAALHDLDQVVHLPGLPRREVSLLKEQRTKLNATVGVLAGARARVEGLQGQDDER